MSCILPKILQTKLVSEYKISLSPVLKQMDSNLITSSVVGLVVMQICNTAFDWFQPNICVMSRQIKKEDM